MYDLVLFDADDTLFDFQASENHSFHAVCGHHGLGEHAANLLQSYKTISHELWSQHEQGTLSKERLKILRFERLFSEAGFDLDCTRFGEHYLDLLSQAHHLIDGAVEICEFLSSRARLAIVSNGIQKVQASRLKLSPIGRFMEFSVVSEECGYSKPDPRIFQFALDRAKLSNRSRVLMVGDRLEADVKGAQNAGITACWFNPHSLSSGDIRPEFEIRELSDLRGFWSSNM